ncbi:hypothetical protein SmJEL517_g01310 [Synchytrium microbalum]|uniref:Enkurin domain-containing protein n=1 Tax=Synchytrium microbalum TaxID=1806994 RepID=A0A507CB48_9FUNG|nr:uncharacterized protein SmJEL517_g01310 [Synchytrium microbalum]TPX36578.1 hypothetical protein SmJEL517_g01310 [Synchytrium microbalum]
MPAPRRTSPPTAISTNASTIPTDPFDESVYRLIPATVVSPPRQPRHRSRYADQSRTEYFSGRKDTASMGPAKVDVRNPKTFLKKGELEARMVRKDFYQPDRSVRKDPMPHGLTELPSGAPKDFIRMNALSNINTEAKKPNSTGPAYRFKPDYGKTPEYVLKLKDQMAASAAEEKAHAEKIAAERPAQAGLIPLPESERQVILSGLKSNLEKLEQEYGRLSLTTDTVPKINRKVGMERDLRRLEEDIKKFSRPNIYVDISFASPSAV